MTHGTRPKGLDAAITRYGSVRSFTLRSLYTWLTLTMLALFTWPLVIVYADAPAVTPQETPLGWFQVRLIAQVLVAVATGWLWSRSPAPTTTGTVSAALAVLRRGRIWPQVVVFLAGTIVVVSLFLLAENPGGAIRLILLTGAESATICIIIAGYLHAILELVLPDRRADFAAIGLFALTFVMRGVLAIASVSDISQAELVNAGVAGLVGGAIIGGVAVFLRARTGSIVPVILGLWLLFLVLGLSGFYEQ